MYNVIWLYTSAWWYIRIPSVRLRAGSSGKFRSKYLQNRVWSRIVHSDTSNLRIAQQKIYTHDWTVTLLGTNIKLFSFKGTFEDDSYPQVGYVKFPLEGKHSTGRVFGVEASEFPGGSWLVLGKGGTGWWLKKLDHLTFEILKSLLLRMFLVPSLLLFLNQG